MCLRLIAETDARSVSDSHPSCSNLFPTERAFLPRKKRCKPHIEVVQFWGSKFKGQGHRINNTTQ